MDDVDTLARVRLTFPEAPHGVEATEVLRLLSALTYEYDVVALMKGAEPTDSSRSFGLDSLPDFRPRWSPRLREDDIRLRIGGVTYGSPLVLEVLGDPSVLADWLKVILGQAELSRGWSFSRRCRAASDRALRTTAQMHSMPKRAPPRRGSASVRNSGDSVSPKQKWMTPRGSSTSALTGQ